MATTISLQAELSQDGLNRLAVDVAKLLRAYGGDPQVLLATMKGEDLLEPASERGDVEEAPASKIEFTEERWAEFLARSGSASLDYLKACAAFEDEFSLADVAEEMGVSHKKALAFNRNVHRTANSIGLPLFVKRGKVYRLTAPVAAALDAISDDDE